MKVGDRVKVVRLIDHEDMLQWLVGKEGELVDIDNAAPEYGVLFEDENDPTFFYAEELEGLK